MNDMDLLKQLPSRIDPPDEATKDRIRTLMEARTAPGPVRRSRRVVKVSVLGVAAVLAVGGVAAAVAGHLWTTDQPVAIPVAAGPASTSEDAIGVEIQDPTGPVTRADLEAVVAEFAPAIRLPEGRSFEAWTQRLLANPETVWGGLTRANVVSHMVIVSECQWGQQWLDASANGDPAGTQLAFGVLSGVSDWTLATGIDVDSYMAGLLDHMNNGDASGI